MKKLFTLLVIGLCLLLTGCDKEENDFGSSSINNDNGSNNQLKEPKIEWCQLYNPNGFDTVTCIVSNPNEVDIDFYYDLVFYKDGEEVSRIEDCSNFNVSSKHNDIILVNNDVPSSEDVDEVKMENIVVSEAYYESINGNVKYLEKIENEAYFSAKFDKQPKIGTIWILLYNDDNNNKKCDKDELVIVYYQSVFDKENKISIDIDVDGAQYGIDYNSYDIYYNAY